MLNANYYVHVLWEEPSLSPGVLKAKGLTLQLGECLASYDVISLFTSVPIDPALNIIRDLLEKDEKLNGRTVLSVQGIMEYTRVLSSQYLLFLPK